MRRRREEVQLFLSKTKSCDDRKVTSSQNFYSLFFFFFFNSEPKRPSAALPPSSPFVFSLGLNTVLCFALSLPLTHLTHTIFRFTLTWHMTILPDTSGKICTCCCHTWLTHRSVASIAYFFCLTLSTFPWQQRSSLIVEFTLDDFGWVWLWWRGPTHDQKLSSLLKTEGPAYKGLYSSMQSSLLLSRGYCKYWRGRFSFCQWKVCPSFRSSYPLPILCVATLVLKEKLQYQPTVTEESFGKNLTMISLPICCLCPRSNKVHSLASLFTQKKGRQDSFP